jgi:Ca-activated chloride channel family protein
MTEKRKSVLLALAVTIVAAMPALQLVAQAPAADPNMVYVPVAVTGAKNAYIGGLTKDNFELKEDGKVQTITQFSENQPWDIHIILALAALQRGRADLNSSKIREAVEVFRQTGNAGNKYTVEEMPFGSNGVFDAMSRHVAALTPSPNPRKAVVVLTDGFDSAGGDPGRALQEYAKKEDVPIYIFYSPVPEPFSGPATGPADIMEVGRGRQIHLEGGQVYEDLTRFTGGRLYQADGDTQLRGHLQTLAEELKNQYILGFKSTNDARNDKWRKLEVKVVKPPAGTKDLKTKVKERYFVAKVK